MKGRVAALALLAASCMGRAKLEEYCSRTGTCTCTAGSCCINPGASCAEGQPCCSGTCSAGQCPAAAGGSGMAGGSTTAGGSSAGGRAGGDARACAAPCAGDAGCAVGECCRSDAQCSTGQCLVDVCRFSSERVDGGAPCDDTNDCAPGFRCDLGMATPRCVAEVMSAGPALSACTEQQTCANDGGCAGGLCRAACSAGGPTPCSRAADCCVVSVQACGAA
ncbi:MAG: hypothetical protein JNK82_00500, partial [Myxococcaceae bacterium]|nr:hypothetical protein [Myxococcaceae bacterium]